MLICWSLGPSTAVRVHEHADSPQGRDYRTIATLLNRMVRKGFLGVHRDGKQGVYTPVVPFERAVHEEIRRFLEETLALQPQALKILSDELAAAQTKRPQMRPTRRAS